MNESQAQNVATMALVSVLESEYTTARHVLEILTPEQLRGLQEALMRLSYHHAAALVTRELLRRVEF